MADDNAIEVTGGWMRFIVAARPAGGYFTVENTSDAAIDFTGASSPGCGMIMLHRSVSKDGKDKMMMVKKVEVPAHGSAQFAPGGYHLMCMKPKDALRPGKSVPVTLKFSGGRTVEAQFEVRGPSGQ